MRPKSYSRILLLILLTYFIFQLPVKATALDDYVAAPDANYSIFLIGSPTFDTSTFTRGYVLVLTSQGWRNPSEVDRVLWQHFMTIVVPEWDWLLGSTKNTALLVIGEGDNYDPIPQIDPNYRLLAAATRSVVVTLSAVPNQPLQFSDETIPRSEDEIIAYSWNKYLQGGDPYWPVQLPMVKSVVRCMDAVQTFVGNYAVEKKNINSFVLTGGSKRGWTAWLTAAADPQHRVTAIAPIVSDLLNMKRSFAHHWAAYGFWADALLPYEELGIFDWFDTPQATSLMEIVDPYEYRDRLLMPKFIINAAGDNFFVSDSVRFYFKQLSGETYLRHVPNTDHYLTGAYMDVFSSMAPYYDAFLNGNPRPAFSWTMEDNGSIKVVSVDVPKAVNLWQASNPLTRDFRLPTIGSSWQSSTLTDSGGGVYIGDVNVSESGWTAFFVELVFESPFQGANTYDYHFTTEMRVLPEILPYEADFNRDRITDAGDLELLSKIWLSDNVYRDIAPRMGGDRIINFEDLALFGIHWLEGVSY